MLQLIQSPLKTGNNRACVYVSVCGVTTHFRSGANGIQVKWVPPTSRCYFSSIILW